MLVLNTVLLCCCCCDYFVLFVTSVHSQSECSKAGQGLQLSPDLQVEEQHCHWNSKGMGLHSLFLSEGHYELGRVSQKFWNEIKISFGVLLHCGSGDETTEHLLLLCPKCAPERQRYFGDSIDITDVFQDYESLVEFLISSGHLSPHIGSAWRARHDNNKVPFPACTQPECTAKYIYHTASHKRWINWPH